MFKKKIVDRISTSCLLLYLLFFQIIMYSLIEFESKYGQQPEVEVVSDVWLEKEGKI